jgi:hypothetical protein
MDKKHTRISAPKPAHSLQNNIHRQRKKDNRRITKKGNSKGFQGENKYIQPGKKADEPFQPDCEKVKA